MTTYENVNIALDMAFLVALAITGLIALRERRINRLYYVERRVNKEPALIVIRSNNISYDKFEFLADNIDDYEHSDTIEFYYENRIVARFLRDDIVAYYEKGHINMCNNILEGQKNAS